MQNTSDQPGNWATERDRYVVLLHLYTVAGIESSACLTSEKITRELGFSESHAEELVRSLLRNGFLQHSGVSEEIVLTSRAVDYIETEARRRRSVRALK